MRIEYRQRTQPQSMPQMHAHGLHELYYLLSGTRQYFVEDTIYDVSPGELVLIPRNQLHRTVTTGHFERYVVYFSQEECESITRLVGELACMEKTYFSKRFKALTGFGFQEYLTQTRIRAAQELLRSSRLSVGEVAEACGFAGGNYFGDVFRRTVGVSPSQYRKNPESTDL